MCSKHSTILHKKRFSQPMKCLSLYINHALLKPFRMRDTSKRSYKFYSCVLFMYDDIRFIYVVHVWKIYKCRLVGKIWKKKINNFHLAMLQQVYKHTYNSHKSRKFSQTNSFHLMLFFIHSSRVRSINQIHERCINFPIAIFSLLAVCVHKPYKRVI